MEELPGQGETQLWY